MAVSQRSRCYPEGFFHVVSAQEPFGRCHAVGQFCRSAAAEFCHVGFVRLAPEAAALPYHGKHRHGQRVVCRALASSEVSEKIVLEPALLGIQQRRVALGVVGFYEESCGVVEHCFGRKPVLAYSAAALFCQPAGVAYRAVCAVCVGLHGYYGYVVSCPCLHVGPLRHCLLCCLGYGLEGFGLAPVGMVKAVGLSE